MSCCRWICAKVVLSFSGLDDGRWCGGGGCEADDEEDEYGRRSTALFPWTLEVPPVVLPVVSLGLE